MKILIVGASSGIGRGLAESYLRNGHQVAITGRRQELLKELESAFPENCISAVQDVRLENHPYEDLIRRMGGLDLFIYNAGYGDVSKEINPDLETDITQTNVLGYVRAVSFAFDWFTNHGGGQIAQTSSVAAVRGNGHAPGYSASKAFMSNFAEGLNLKAYKLRLSIAVTDIRPGFVATKMAKSEKLFWVVPVGRAVQLMRRAISKKVRVAYISPRWKLVALLIRALPFSIYRNVG
jgi:NADP-dependent 3-hydroxy acid dehydrogenase YdfG